MAELQFNPTRCYAWVQLTGYGGKNSTCELVCSRCGSVLAKMRGRSGSEALAKRFWDSYSGLINSSYNQEYGSILCPDCSDPRHLEIHRFDRLCSTLHDAARNYDGKRRIRLADWKVVAQAWRTIEEFVESRINQRGKGQA